MWGLEAVSTSAQLPPAMERFLRLYVEIARAMAKRKAAQQAVTAKGQRQDTCSVFDFAV
jgi:hypothetical protein